MKILIIMGGYFPGKKYGGPPVSVDNFCSLMKSHECFVVTCNHDMGEKEPYSGIESETWINRGNCKICYLPDSKYGKAAFRNIVEQIKPDVLYLQGLFQKCVFPCLQLAKKYGLRVLLAPRGELCAGAFRKKYKKIPYIAVLRILGLLRNVSYQSTSEEESAAICKFLGAAETQVSFMSNIPSIPSREFVFEDKTAGVAKLVFLSRIHPKKNLLKALKCLKTVQGNVKFDIYGSLEDAGYWEACQQEIAQLPDNITVKYCGLVSHDQVHETFSKYDAFVFPTFSENYGHVIVEALVSGCPAIISDQTPWLDLREYQAGWVFSLDDDEGFTAAIQTVVDAPSNQFKENAKRYAQQKLDLETLRRQYQAVLERVV